MADMRITKISQLPWKPSGLILDPYAGWRRWWIGTSAKVVFVDKFLCIPDGICADASMLPFGPSVFDQIWSDPPHLIRKSPFKETSRFMQRSKQAPLQKHGYFGTYPTREVMHAEWLAVARELHRVAKPNAMLIWKSIDGAKTKDQCVNNSDLLCLQGWWELKEELRFPSAVSWSSAMTVYTRWIRKPADLALQ